MNESPATQPANPIQSDEACELLVQHLRDLEKEGSGGAFLMEALRRTRDGWKAAAIETHDLNSTEQSRERARHSYQALRDVLKDLDGLFANAMEHLARRQKLPADLVARVPKPQPQAEEPARSLEGVSPFHGRARVPAPAS